MSLLGGLLGSLDVGGLIEKLLIGRAKLEEMKQAEVGETVDLPAVRTKIRGAGYWEIPIGPGKRLK